MKKLLVIIIIASFLGSCAAEKRLARFLVKHPELQRVDTIIQNDTIFLQEEQNTTTISLSKLIAMDSIASAARDSVSKTTDLAVPTVSVATDRSQATITANGDKTFNLGSMAKKDTLFITDTIFQLVLTTEYKEKKVEVYKQKWWQEILSSIGMIAILLAIIYIITRTLTKH